MVSHGRFAPELATLQSGLLVDYRAELIDDPKWIHLHIGWTVQTTLGPPKTERSIFRTLRHSLFPHAQAALILTRQRIPPARLSHELLKSAAVANSLFQVHS